MTFRSIAWMLCALGSVVSTSTVVAQTDRFREPVAGGAPRPGTTRPPLAREAAQAVGTPPVGRQGQSQVVPIDEIGAPRRPAPQGGPRDFQPTSGPAGQRLGPNGEMPKEPILPRPFSEPTPEQQQFLDQLLTAWEKRSDQIERYRCKFERWEYDPVFGPKDPKEAKTYATGRLLYAKPDKGLFQVETIKVYAPPKTPDDSPEWVERKEPGEHWVCDGKRIFEFNVHKKQLIERQLPPEMQGKAIVEGPLPFLFGAKADKLKARYWLRVVTPADVKNEYWLEACPKYRADAMNFKMVHVIIDDQEFLPKALQTFDPNFDPQKRPIRTVFTFDKRELNWSLNSFNPFAKEFYEPKTPFGWKKVVEPFLPEATEPPPAEIPPTASKSNLPNLPFKNR